MRTVAETPMFIQYASEVWSEAELVYAKVKFDALPASFLAQLKQGVEDAL